MLQICSGKRPLPEEVVWRQPERIDPEFRQPCQELDPWNTGKTCRCARGHATDFIEFHGPGQSNLVGKLRWRQPQGPQRFIRVSRGMSRMATKRLRLISPS